MLGKMCRDLYAGHPYIHLISFEIFLLACIDTLLAGDAFRLLRGSLCCRDYLRSKFDRKMIEQQQHEELRITWNYMELNAHRHRVFI